MGMVLTILGGYVASKFGRRTMFLVSMPFIILGWLLTYFATDITMLFAGRIITCAFVCGYLSCVGVYISETAHPDIRGSLVIVSPLFLAGGMLTNWTLGYFFSWRIMAAAGIIPCIWNLLLMFYLPETPYWLIENNEFEKAQKSLKFFRGPNFDVQEELDEIHQRHLHKQHTEIGLTLIFKRLFSRAFFKPFLCIGVTNIFFTMCGFDILQTYMVSVLEDSGSSIDPELAPIIIGVTRVTFAGIAPFVYGKIPAKILFTIAQFTAALCMATIGLFAYCHKLYDLQEFAWVPLLAIIVTYVTRALGTLPVLHTLVNELYPTEIRTVAIGIDETLFSGLVGIMLKIYPSLRLSFGFHGACIFYSAMGLLCAIWGCLTIPDTRGKSLVKVEEFYEKK